MKIRSLVLAAAFALFTGAAQANAINYSGAVVSMGTVLIGQTGTISNPLGTVLTLPHSISVGSLITGKLPQNAIITFTYTFTGLRSGVINSTSGYNYTKAGNHYAGFSNGDSLTGVTNFGSVNGVSGTALVFATADMTAITGGHASGTTTVANFTSLAESFASAFLGSITRSPRGTGIITYVVSSIPLPASLPVVLLAVAGLFIVSSRKNRALAA